MFSTLMSYCDLFCASLARLGELSCFSLFLSKPGSSLLFTAMFKKQLSEWVGSDFVLSLKKKSVCLHFSQNNILEAKQIERLSMKNAVCFVLLCLSVFPGACLHPFLVHDCEQCQGCIYCLPVLLSYTHCLFNTLYLFFTFSKQPIAAVRNVAP